MTGANGFLGHELLRIFDEKSVSPIRLQRDVNNLWHIHSDLADSADPRTRLGYLIHLAVPRRRASRRDWDLYHQATSSLFHQARRKGLNIVQISSMSAHPGNPSLYSEQKRVSENLTKDHGGIVVRLGIIESTARRSPHRRLDVLMKLFPMSLFLAPGVNLLRTNTLLLQEFVSDLISGRITRIKDWSYGTPIFSGFQSASKWRKLVSTPFSTFLLSGRRRFPESEIIERAINLHFGMEKCDLPTATRATSPDPQSDMLRRGYRFLAVGTINTVIYASVLFALSAAGAPLALANVTSLSIAALSSYAMNSGYVFQTKITRLNALVFLGTLGVLMASIGYFGSLLNMPVWQVGVSSAICNVSVTLLFFYFLKKKRRVNGC
jgi:putative flippase GtrA